MNWRNVQLIWAREIRDQLRDRRMLFMICVLPLLLYPLLGTSFMQLSQFMRHHEARVWVFGANQLDDATSLPPLIENGQFASNLFGSPLESEKLHVSLMPRSGRIDEEIIEDSRRELLAGSTDAVVIFPEDFAERLQLMREQLQKRDLNGKEALEAIEVPRPLSLYDSPREASQIAHIRLDRLINRWQSEIVQRNLEESRVPLNVTQPFQLDSVDVAGKQQKQAALYSKLLPFIVFLWALTGAFYPAVDLCAGEKERGTLEALLGSPARRSEIVWGKLLTVMLFSVFTAILNLASIGFTAAFVARQMTLAMPNSAGMFSLPPLISIVWILLALLPISAIFSALSIACSAFARSTKEGQYYYMPLFMITLPLMLLPLSPGSELNLGNSLIPIAGLSFLLREFMEGDYIRALPYVVPVILVTFGCCWLTIRWAIELFNQESVLFRENERFELRAWLVHLVRDRKATPSVGMALACVAIIFVLKFFIGFAVSPTVLQGGPEFLFRSVIVPQLCILLPALAMAWLFTSDPRKTLLLSSWPRASALLASAVLAFAFYPVGRQIASWIFQLYPLDANALESAGAIAKLLESSSNFGTTLLLFALLPAICEELAFRGFVLSGLRHLGHKWWAIGLTAVLFGLAHTVLFQQSLAAATTGVLIGFLAVQTGQIAPCILFHFAYNGITFALLHWAQPIAESVEKSEVLGKFFQPSPDKFQPFSWEVVVVGSFVTLAILWWFHRLDSPQSPEERLNEARLQPVQRPFAQDLS